MNKMFKIDNSHVGTMAYGDSYVRELENKLADAKNKIIEQEKLISKIGHDLLAFGDTIRNVAGLPKRGETMKRNEIIVKDNTYKWFQLRRWWE